MATRKAPRRTAERILQSSLALFNRFGEPGVSTNAIAAELNISPGNLYYHFPAKDNLINALFDQHELALHPILEAADSVSQVEDAWFFLHSLVEVNWQHRFVFRNLNELLSRNRQLETQVRRMMDGTTAAMNRVLHAMEQAGSLRATSLGWAPVATCMVVLLTYWLSYEYVLNPRQAMEDANAGNAALNSAAHVLGVLAPYVVPTQQAHLQQLMEAYTASVQSGSAPTTCAMHAAT